MSTRRPPAQRPRVLLVDDEQAVLDGLALVLRRRYAVLVARSGHEALEVVADGPPVEVVVSDLRMPGMDGIALLTAMRTAAPDATRMLLSGNADLSGATSAVNQGGVFRLLEKPCPHPVLMAALDDAVAQHRLVTSERVLLQETLVGSVAALTAVLGIAHPAALGMAQRLRALAGPVTRLLGGDPWAAEVAATMFPVGCVALPLATVLRYTSGEPLSDADLLEVDRLPVIAGSAVARIPRLEPVLEILREVGRPTGHAGTCAGARALRAVIEFDRLEGSGLTASGALAAMRLKAGVHDDAALEALASAVGALRGRLRTQRVRLGDLQPGGVLAADVRDPAGVLLMARGHAMTAEVVTRLRETLSDHDTRLDVTMPATVSPPRPW